MQEVEENVDDFLHLNQVAVQQHLQNWMDLYRLKSDLLCLNRTSSTIDLPWLLFVVEEGFWFE